MKWFRVFVTTVAFEEFGIVIRAENIWGAMASFREDYSDSEWFPHIAQMEVRELNW